MTSSWFFLSTLNYDARSTTHQTKIYVTLTNLWMIIYTAPMNTTLHAAAVAARSVSTTRLIRLSKLSAVTFYFTVSVLPSGITEVNTHIFRRIPFA